MLGMLWVRGVPADWNSVFEGSGAQKLAEGLPVYAFQRRKYWLDSNPSRPAGLGIGAGKRKQDNGAAITSCLGDGVMLQATSIPGTGKISFLGGPRVHRSESEVSKICNWDTYLPLEQIVLVGLLSSHNYY